MVSRRGDLFSTTSRNQLLTLSPPTFLRSPHSSSLSCSRFHFHSPLSLSSVLISELIWFQLSHSPMRTQSSILWTVFQETPSSFPSLTSRSVSYRPLPVCTLTSSF